MRKYLFRGKIVDSGEWVEGSLIVDHYDCAGKPNDVFRIVDIYYGVDDENFPTYQSGLEETVVPSTIGQFTGLYDAHGVPIFEGDILQFGDKKLLVWWNDECFQWQARSILSYNVITHDDIHPFSEWNNIDLGWIAAEPICTGCMTTLIIGNIFDNPDLIGGCDNDDRRQFESAQ